MLLEKIKELKKQSGMSSKQIAEATNLPERTVSRIFSGDTDDPYASTLHRIVKALGGSLDDILADTGAVVSSKNLATLQEELATVTAERDRLITENATLNERVAELSGENKVLAKQLLEHKDELLDLLRQLNKLNNR